MTTEAETPRRAAYWLVIAAALAVQWAASGAFATAGAGCPTTGISNALSQPATPAGSDHLESPLPAPNLTGLSNTRPSDDDLLATPLPAQPLNYGSRLCAGAGYADPRMALPRGFDPRAPPPTA